MSNTEQQIEQEIQDKGLTAPRITPEHIDNQIIGEQYFVFPGTTVTICLLQLVNGFTVTGESACASPENFDEEIGRKIAREQARDKIWALEGYLLKDKLHNGKEIEESKMSCVGYGTRIHSASSLAMEKIYPLVELLRTDKLSNSNVTILNNKLENLIKDL